MSSFPATRRLWGFIRKLGCVLIGHDDPVMDCLGFVGQDELFRMLDEHPRRCRRCRKSLKENE